MTYSAKAQELYDKIFGEDGTGINEIKILTEALTTIGNEREAVGYANGIEAAAKCVEKCRYLIRIADVELPVVVSHIAAEVRALPPPPKGK